MPQQTDMGLYTELEVNYDVRLSYPNRKMGILGGTFNPIHNGHVDMALRIKDELALDEVLLIPSGQPPHKEKDVAPKQKRLHMAALCAYEYQGLSVSDIEVKRLGYSYTVDTLTELHERYKDTDFYFIIGSDTLFELETWKDFQKLFQLTSFVCVQRYICDNVQLLAKAMRLKELYGAHIIHSAYVGLDISSSTVRKYMKEGLSISELVPPPVEEYILESGLYR